MKRVASRLDPEAPGQLLASSSDVMVYPDETSAQCGSSFESLLKSIFGPILDPFLEPLLDPLLDACDFLCKL